MIVTYLSSDLIIPLHIKPTTSSGDCWDVRQCFVRQFKSELVRRLEGLVFEKKTSEIEPKKSKVEQNINRT